jgi:hypothetical protein
MPVAPVDPATAIAAKIAAKTFGELATRLANSVIDSAAKPLTAMYEAITTNFEPHLKATFVRCTKVKTILNREEPADLLNLYVGLRFSCAKKEYDDFGVIDEIHARRRVVISGTGGGGKTFFMKYFWLSIFENSRGKIPVFVELRKLNEISNDNLLAYIYRTIVNTNANVSDDAFRKAIRNGTFTFLFDGFDEVAKEKRQSLTKQILDIAANNPDCTIVISSRPDSLFESWQSFSIFGVQPLSQGQVLSIIEKIKYDDSAKKKFSERIKKDLWARHQSFLSSPLLATMMLMTFSQFADIPDKVHLFYDQAFDTLFYKHDAVKELYQRKMYTDLTSDIFRKFFSLFCLVSYYDQVFEFSEGAIREYIEKGLKIEGAELNIEDFLKDLTESICILQKDGVNYVFSHRSFQEYFCAYCLDRILQAHAGPILERIAERHTDTTIPMLFDMNKDVVEKNLVQPFLARVSKDVGDVRKKGFIQRHFLFFESALRLDFYRDQLDNCSFQLGEFAGKLSLLSRLYPDQFHGDTINYGQKDNEILSEQFPGWRQNQNKRRNRDSIKQNSREFSSIEIRAERQPNGLIDFVSVQLNGTGPTITGFDWIEELGYATYCKDNLGAFFRIQKAIAKMQKSKIESIDKLFRL